MHTDVAVIGGSFAGLSAALQLARARRTVTVIDAGEPRNRFAAASHGFLTRDGATPAGMLSDARRQLLAYPTVRMVDGRVGNASGAADGFVLACEDGSTIAARRLVLAYGVKDTLPDIPGLADQWGRRVAHCPYCHGYEFDRGALGVLATGPAAIHHAILVAEWGPVTLFLNGVVEPDADQARMLRDRGIAVERARVTAVTERGPGLALELAGVGSAKVVGLFTQPRSCLSSGIAGDLGCHFAEGPFGSIIAVNEMKRTSVTGVFAAGDAARAAGNVAISVADGALAGTAAHQSLVFG